MSIYMFKIWYDINDIPEGGFQERFVVAETEEEAREKLEKHNEAQVSKGFAPFFIGKSEVYILDVIM